MVNIKNHGDIHTLNNIVQNIQTYLKNHRMDYTGYHQFKEKLNILRKNGPMLQGCNGEISQLCNVTMVKL